MTKFKVAFRNFSDALNWMS